MTRAMQLRKPGGLDNLLLTEVGVDGPGRGQILVRLHASSLNYHDYAVVAGMIPTDEGRIPMSDGAGVVAEVGEGVTELAVGDHVVSTFFPNWPSGDPSPEKLTSVPGDSTDGYARERVVAPTRYFTKVPRDYTHAQAATLPCAALTAWRALVVEGRIKPGETVLVQGTGGVSIFALQFAKAAGCKVIATSSSAAKLERLKSLGADQVINYKDVPAWGDAARHLAGGQGVDHIVEIGGAGTLSQSIAAARIGGHISLIGVLAGYQGDVSTATLMMKQIRLIGIGVGTREQQQDMIRAIDAAGIKPVIDRSFPLEELAAAFRYQESGAHFGKICVEF